MLFFKIRFCFFIYSAVSKKVIHFGYLTKMALYVGLWWKMFPPAGLAAAVARNVGTPLKMASATANGWAGNIMSYSTYVGVFFSVFSRIWKLSYSGVILCAGRRSRPSCPAKNRGSSGLNQCCVSTGGSSG